jgi:hypothetical protein
LRIKIDDGADEDEDVNEDEDKDNADNLSVDPSKVLSFSSCIPL